MVPHSQKKKGSTALVLSGAGVSKSAPQRWRSARGTRCPSLPLPPRSEGRACDNRVLLGVAKTDQNQPNQNGSNSSLVKTQNQLKKELGIGSKQRPTTSLTFGVAEKTQQTAGTPAKAAL